MYHTWILWVPLYLEGKWKLVTFWMSNILETFDFFCKFISICESKSQSMMGKRIHPKFLEDIFWIFLGGSFVLKSENPCHVEEYVSYVIAPEKWCLEDELPFGSKGIFSGGKITVSFREGIHKNPKGPVFDDSCGTPVGPMDLVLSIPYIGKKILQLPILVEHKREATLKNMFVVEWWPEVFGVVYNLGGVFKHRQTNFDVYPRIWVGSIWSIQAKFDEFPWFFQGGWRWPPPSWGCL